MPLRRLASVFVVAAAGSLAGCSDTPGPTPSPSTSSATVAPSGEGSGAASSGEDAAGRSLATIDYAGDSSPAHRLDLYRPDAEGPHPVVVWVHGGGWLTGDRTEIASSTIGMKQFLDAMLAEGYAVASVDYRLTGTSQFPAQIQDVNGAIRYLRRQGSTLGLDSSRLVVAGDSAGGQLALLAAMGGSSMQGSVGGTSGEGRVTAAMSFYGVTDFTRMFSDRKPLQNCPASVVGLDSPEGRLLGVDPSLKKNAAVARRASPVYNVKASNPPIYLTHGRWDCTVPAAQSERLDAAIKAKGGKSQLTLIDASHADRKFFTTGQSLDPVMAFLQRHLE